MREDEFGGAVDRAFAFCGSLIGGMNLSIGIMTLLQAKGMLTQEDVLWIFDGAVESCARMELPQPWDKFVADTLARGRAVFE